MRSTSVLALVSLVGCSGTPTEDTAPTPECTDGDTQVSDIACGANDRGLFDELCVNGTWEEGDCVDPDECTDGDTDTEPCYDGTGTQALVCDAGSWVTDGRCTINETLLVSVAADGSGADGQSLTPDISADGRWIVFASEATNLVAGDTNGVTDIFLRDLETRTTTLISKSADGTLGDNRSQSPSITADGRFVVFTSRASNLVSGDTNGAYDVFVAEVATGEITRVNVDNSGNESAGGGANPSITDDGNLIAFESYANDLVAQDNGGTGNIYLHDRRDGSTIQVSVAAARAVGGSVPTDSSYNPRITPDGRYIVFASQATNLRYIVPSSPTQIWIYDVGTGLNTKISVNSAGEDADNHCSLPSISDDGSLVTYNSSAQNLVSGITNFTEDVYVYDGTTTTLESVTLTGEAAGAVYYPRISGDGAAIVFQSSASTMVTNDDSGAISDVFLRDLISSETRLLSTALGGTGSDGFSGDPAISGDGRHVVFGSDATNLVSGDTNGLRDLFVTPTR